MTIILWAALGLAILAAAPLALLAMLADTAAGAAADADRQHTDFDTSWDRYGYIQRARNRGEM